jgi:putative flippase GtrA
MPLDQALITEIGRIARFGVTGLVSALTYALFTLVLEKTGLVGPIVATAIGYAFAATISYLGHLHFSFAVEPNHRVYLVRFALTVVVTFAIAMACTWLFTRYWSYSFYAAIAAATVLIPIISYLCQRLWVFLPGLRTQR